MRTSKAQLKVQQDTIQHLEWELEVLKQRFADVEAERDELYDRFVRTIYDVQQKSGFKNLVLEKKLAALSESLEKKVRCSDSLRWWDWRPQISTVFCSSKASHASLSRPDRLTGGAAERGFAGLKFGPYRPLRRYKEIGGERRGSRMAFFAFLLSPVLLSNLNTRSPTNLFARTSWMAKTRPSATSSMNLRECARRTMTLCGRSRPRCTTWACQQKSLALRW